jgi:cold shock CspA family protein
VTDTTATKYTGVVRFFGDRGAYGFIEPHGGGKDVFVHITAVAQAGLRGTPTCHFLTGTI